MGYYRWLTPPATIRSPLRGLRACAGYKFSSPLGSLPACARYKFSSPLDTLQASAPHDVGRRYAASRLTPRRAGLRPPIDAGRALKPFICYSPPS
jgi:hypothetical protein